MRKGVLGVEKLMLRVLGLQGVVGRDLEARKRRSALFLMKLRMLGYALLLLESGCCFSTWLLASLRRDDCSVHNA